MTGLVLASGSPRRREILRRLGIDFEVVVPAVEELREGPPVEAVLENARRKARSVLAAREDDVVVLGVDTEVVLEGRLLGKAGTEEEASRHLESLSGRTHEVLSGVVLLGPTAPDRPDDAGAAPERSGLACSAVTFGDLDPATIGLYLASGEWRDRAGAYAIQGLGSMLVARLEGDFSNVVGLPVRELVRLAPELFPRR